tara:strand:- start:398 stop:526 length:129 start_codon:yes stop_codon:yes gene_type:complete
VVVVLVVAILQMVLVVAEVALAVIVVACLGNHRVVAHLLNLL